MVPKIAEDFRKVKLRLKFDRRETFSRAIVFIEWV